LQSFVTVREFSALASCYAELNGRLRPKAEVRHYGNSRIFQIPHLLGYKFFNARMTMNFPLCSRTAVLLAGAFLHFAASAADVVPLTFVNGLPFATVKIGAVASRLMIDTGGSLSVSIPEQTIKESGAIRLLEQKTKFRDLQGQVHEVQNFVADQVTLGATKLGPINGQVHVQWGGAPEGPEAELTNARQTGAIGLAAFGKRPVMFDYQLATLSLYELGERPQAGQQGWQALRLESGKIGPNVTLIVNGKPLKFVLDTGAQVNLVNNKSLVPVAAESFCQPAPKGADNCDPRDLGAVHDSNGQSLRNLKAERIDLNGAPFDGILGAPFFQSHKVLFDLAADRLLISPSDAKFSKSN
jgi:hypothetical protein